MKEDAGESYKSNSKKEESKTKALDKLLSSNKKSLRFDPLELANLYINYGNNAIFKELLETSLIMGNQYFLKLIESLPSISKHEKEIVDSEYIFLKASEFDFNNLNNSKENIISTEDSEDVFSIPPNFLWFSGEVQTPNYIILP